MTECQQRALGEPSAPPPKLTTPTPASRVAGALIAVAAGGSVLSAVVVGFHLQAPAAWLANTPQVLAEAAACERRGARADRDACRQRLVQTAAAAPSAPRALERLAAR